MIKFIKSFFSPDCKIIRIEKSLKKAHANRSLPAIISIFSNGFLYLLRARRYDLLSSFVLSHLSQIQDAAALKNSIQAKDIEQSISALESTKHDASALSICDYFGLQEAAIEILAKKGRANDLAMRIAKDRNPDKGILEISVLLWEKHNGDITKSPTMTETVKNIGKFSLECLPDNPRVKEIVGQKKEAAFLYEKENDFANAARCYEEIEMYSQACTLYAGIKDNESVSRTAEALGDLEKALQFVVKPDRKIKLLIRMERFIEANKYAAGLESPEEYFALIREKAKARMGVKVKSHNFIEAIELANVAECETSEKEEILLRGRAYYDQQLVSAASEEAIREIYKERVQLEEKSGKFEEAGKIAEEILKDLKLASLLYEKANLFNRAIHATSESAERQKNEPSSKLRLAELHEKGGNLLSAAQLYEQCALFDKAFILYEKLLNYSKAIDCYKKTTNLDKHVLAGLYIKGEEFEKAVEIYLQSDTFSELEQAMAIARTYNLTTHLNEISEKIGRHLSGSDADLKRCFAVSRDEVVSSYSSVIGIDFGTTNSVGAIFNKKTKKVEIITVPGSADKDFEPSFFGVDENNHPLFGEKARLRSLTAPDCVMARIKRTLGEGRSFSVGNKKYKSEEIVAKIIQKMKFNAEAYLRAKVETRFREVLLVNNLRFPEEKIESFVKHEDFIHVKDVVLTVPAYFNDNQKRATRDSAEIAGLRVLRLLHEPTAAALAYGYHKSYSGTFAVVDLGGGTLDISILEVGEGVYEIQSISGDVKLGGSDVDTALLQYVISDIEKTLNITVTEKDHPIEINRLRDSCENMKINLSSLDTYTMELTHFLNKPQYAFTLTRKELERISRPVTHRIKDIVEKAIKAYGGSIDHFILVGNATKMPAVVEVAKSVIRARHLQDLNAGSVVAAGAALEGAILLGDLKEHLLLDVVPYSLGISILKKDSKVGEEEMSRLIEKNTTIPTIKSQEYTTTKDNQTGVNIRIYQGEALVPGKNYFLGDFHLEGILPAPAGTPKIEVKFEIGADCILTVTAIDKGTTKQQSIRIEGAVTLSPGEKAGLRKYFTESENIYPLEKKIDETKNVIDGLFEAFDKTVQVVEQGVKDFVELFHEKVEVNARFYKATAEQARVIQGMFSQKDHFLYALQKYKDEATSTRNNLKQILSKHLDYSDKEIVSKMEERFNILSKLKESFVHTTQSVEKDVLHVVIEWIQILKAMDPDMDKMSLVRVANYHFVAGRFAKAKEIIGSMAIGPEGLSEEAFQLLLRCIIRLCLREEYRDTHKKYGNVFKLIYPDFNRLDSFLKSVDDSVYMIQAQSPQGSFVGSGFSVASNLIATNRHVVEGATAQNIRVISKNKIFSVACVEVDPINDLAILKVNENLTPFRLGEFNFVAPGEQVLALGFPSPSSNVHGENIYISRGIVNSIRSINVSPERVIFIDAKIGRGMSGGPLINDLGEVIGIITLIRYEIEQSDKGAVAIGDQPVALPIHLVRNYLLKHMVTADKK